jgi:hypothetical protein
VTVDVSVAVEVLVAVPVKITGVRLKSGVTVGGVPVMVVVGVTVAAAGPGARLNKINPRQ